MTNTTTYKMTDSQLGIYLECAANPEACGYNIPMCITLPDAIDSVKWENAVRKTASLHAAMHVVIASEGGAPVMKSVPRNIEIDHIKADNIDSICASFVRPFDLENGPLYRFAMVNTPSKIYFLYDFHHVISDGTSVYIFLQQVIRAYEGKLETHEEHALLAQAELETERKTSEIHIQDLNYYEKLLSGIDCDSKPVTDPETNRDDKECAVLVSSDGRFSVKDVESFVKAKGLKTFAFLMSAFAYTLAKTNGADNCCFTTVNSGRKQSDLTNAFGCFIQLVPVYAEIDETQTAAEFANKLQTQICETFKHSTVSFGELATKYGMTSDVSFVYQGELFRGYNVLEERLEVHAIPRGNAQSAVVFMVHKAGNSFEVDIQYHADLYAQATMHTLANNYIQIVSELLKGIKLSEIDLLGATGKTALDQFNQREAAYDTSKTVVDLFREQAKLHPEHLALVYKDCKYTYAQVDEITERIAGFLRSKGIGRENVVSILIPRCEYMLLASLGVLKAGAGYQPLDPSYPPERLNFMMKDAGAKYLITEDSLRDIVNEYEGPVLLIKDIPALPVCAPLTNRPEPNDLFIMLYTSGSTGLPKGCMLEHRNIAAFVNWYRKYNALDENCRAAAYASYGFDANMMDTYPTITSGACLHIIDESIRLELNAINQYFETNHITHGFMTTQVGRQFAASIENKSLRYMGVGGEALSPIEPPKSYQFSNYYGPTECTVMVTYYTIDKLYNRVPVGNRLENIKLYVVDKLGRALPAGMPGELWVAGHQVARGYLNRPEKTAEAFTSNPFTNETGYERVYHTGDIVRMLPNGCIDFIGRRDAQVKIRGFRIELTEVEEVIRRFNGIKDVAATAFDHPAGGKFVAAYVVSDHEVDIAALNTFIASEKPPYLVPAVTMQIDKIPLTQNQKVNKRALPTPVLTKADKKKNDRPLTQCEERIASVIKTSAGIDVDDPSESLQNFGLTSISSISLSTALEKAFGIEVTVKMLLSGMSLMDIENHFFKTWMAGAHVETKQPKHVIRDRYPLTQTQMGIYAECMMTPSSTAYNIPFAYKLPKSVGAQRLADALKRVLEAHTVVKCNIAPDDNGDVCMFPNENAEVIIPVSSGTADEFEALRCTFVVPFDMKQGPLYHAAIFETDEAIYMLLDFHHIVFDGASSEILQSELDRALLKQDLVGEKKSLFDVAIEEADALKTNAHDEAKQYYDTLMSCTEGCTLPEPDRHDKTPSCARISQLHEELNVQAIRTFCETNNLTYNALFLAAAAVVIGKFTNTDDVAFATIYNGRSGSGLSQLFGMLVKTLPVVLNTAPDKTTVDFIRETGKQLLQSMNNDLYSFAEISRSYAFSADLLITYQGKAESTYTIGGYEAERVIFGSDNAKANLMLQFYEHDKGFLLTAEFRDNIYSSELVSQILDSLAVVVRTMTTARTLANLSFVSDAQVKQLDTFNQTDVAYDQNKTVVEQFIEQAHKTPNNKAVIHLNKIYTFAQVDELTDRIAAKLRAQGVGREDVVSVLIPRCEYMVIASLGILKAGAAYQPLDPSYPPDRLDFMMKDASAKYLIADESLLGRIAAYNGPVLLTRDIPALPHADKPAQLPSPTDLFIMLYTSGSTGLPKGCMLEHRNIAAFVNWYRKYYALNEQSCVAAYASYGFDACMMDIYPAMTTGACVHIVDESIRLELYGLNAYFEENNITHSFMTTQLGRQFAADIKNHSLKHLSVGGEALVPIDLAQDFHFHNGYGPTECTIFTTIFDVDKLYDRVPIGKPLDNLKLYIVDKLGRRLPPYAPGELWISGHQVARGYLNRPEKNAETFTQNPFNNTPNFDRVYHTGDVVRFLNDGNVDFIGRRDSQVKIRGFRIELTEIEEIIRRFENIKDATVVAYDHPTGGKFVAAYIVSDVKIDIEALNAFIRAEKPPYLVPSVTMQIDAIPLNQNQKVNKKLLPKPEYQVNAREYIAPETPLEKEFCDKFAEILQLDRVGATDNYFEIGGTSLNATKLVMHAMNAGHKLVYKNVFDYPTPRALAEFISGSKHKLVSASVSDIHSYNYEKINDLLQYNTLANVDNISPAPLNSIVLAGATGFLGIHVLKAFLDRYPGTAYCLVRKGRYDSCETRLEALFVYYFGKSFSEYGDRVVCLEGDITDPPSLDMIGSVNADVVINCAACVKHFVKDDTLDKINFIGVKNLIDVCLRYDLQFVQISTYSVGGMGGEAFKNKRISENQLYFGQSVDTDYVRTKFLAERAVLEAIINNNLSAKIIRVGNLMSRDEDGEFQVNFAANSFMRSLKAYVKLGKFPYAQLNQPVEFSPIDTTAASILAITASKSRFTVYQSHNNHTVVWADVMDVIRKCGYSIEFVSDKDFANCVNAAAKDEKMSEIVLGLVAYAADDNNAAYLVGSNNTLTTNLLYHLNFKWPITDNTYLSNAIKALASFRFFK